MKVVCLVSLLLLLAISAHAGPVVYLNASGSPTVVDNPKATDAVSALKALASAPKGLSTAIPFGAKVLDLRIGADSATVNFSKQLAAGSLSDAKIEAIFEQVKWTLWYYGIELEIRILADGMQLSSFAKPTPVVSPKSKPEVKGTGALAGKTITLSPGHGLVWNGKEYGNQRSMTCDRTLSCEDDHNVEHAQFLEVYLRNDGMTVNIPRCTDKSLGDHASGNAWWRMCSVYWLQREGYPCTIWGSVSDCELSSGISEWNDDIRARPMASDYDDTDVYISLHTNALTGNCTGTACPTGSCMYYDCGVEHAAWCDGSRKLGELTNSAMVDVIHSRNQVAMADWRDRGVFNSNGAYGEIRIPDRPAILLELGFHDSCDMDVLQLKDNFFRCAAMWGIYKGICDYFGTKPTWDFYSDELVSHTIPSAMAPGETKSVSITLRNMGVLWNQERGFKLGAVGDSDPFTSVTRHDVTSEIGPNGTVTFTFDLTAPSAPGTYATDWQMLREGVEWFGARCEVKVKVGT